MKKKICSGIAAVIAAVAINSFNVPESYSESISGKGNNGHAELAADIKQGIQVEYEKTVTEEIIKFGSQNVIYKRIELKKDYFKNFIPGYETKYNISDLIFIVPDTNAYINTKHPHWSQLWWIFLKSEDANYLENKINNCQSIEIHNITSSKKYNSFRERTHDLYNKLFIDNKLLLEKKPQELPKLYQN